MSGEKSFNAIHGRVSVETEQLGLLTRITCTLESIDQSQVKIGNDLRQLVALWQAVVPDVRALSAHEYRATGPDDAPEIVEPGAFEPLRSVPLERIAESLEKLVTLITDEGEQNDERDTD